MTDLEAVIKEFVAESRESLDRLEQDLVQLEADPWSRDTLDSIFRTIHTIKGATGFMGLPKLGALTHAGENLLGRLREGTIVMNASIASALLTLSDCIRRMLAHFEQTGQEEGRDCSGLIEKLTRLQVADEATEAASRGRTADGDRSWAAGATVRVSVEHLDALMNLIGELAVARDEIAQLAAAQNAPALPGTFQRLSTITTQLQEGIMRIRMQPIDYVFSKLPRVARDTAQVCRKRVTLEIHGGNTELDRTLLEAIQDPLTHVIRNCIDHGIEAPEERLAAGKPAHGRLSLRALPEGGQVTIELSDDGRGIDVAAVRRKAVERGAITADRAGTLTEQEATNLIFLPGLSTARAVTSVSGRGVGMDVVKTNIEQIGGKVTIQSQLGTGTIVRMRIPLTLAD
jgi:two-component system, chemotaxis family, sensor kinase CheA